MKTEGFLRERDFKYYFVVSWFLLQQFGCRVTHFLVDVLRPGQTFYQTAFNVFKSSKKDERSSSCPLPSIQWLCNPPVSWVSFLVWQGARPSLQGEEARADPRPSNSQLGRARNEVKSQPLLLAPEQGYEGQAELCGGGQGFCRVLRVRRSCSECQWAKPRVWDVENGF